VHVGDQPGFEPLAQAVLQRGEVAGRPVGGEHELAARFIERVERVEELLLGARLALEELDVVDQQHVARAVARLEVIDAAGLQRVDEVVREALDRRVANARGGVVSGDVVADRV